MSDRRWQKMREISAGINPDELVTLVAAAMASGVMMSADLAALQRKVAAAVPDAPLSDALRDTAEDFVDMRGDLIAGLLRVTR